MIHLLEEEIEAFGLQIAGFDEGRQARTWQQTNREHFRAFYGTSPANVAAIFSDLQTTNTPEARMRNPNPRDLFMCLNWLESYKTKMELAGHYNCDEKTARKWIWHYARKIQALKEDKVSFGFTTNCFYYYYHQQF